MRVPRPRAAIPAALAATLVAASLTVIAAGTTPASAAEVRANGDAIVHLFQWRWDSIAEECETNLGPNGWGGVQVSPPQEHVVLPSAEGATYPWWQDYQPVSYRLDATRRGTKAQFVDMVERCRAQGVKIYVDMVLNHMSGTGSAGAGPGSAGTVYGKYSYPNLFDDGSGDSYGYADFGPCYRRINNWGNKQEVQDCELLDLADLNTADPEVRRKIAKYMNAVIDLGVAGFRVDAAKHVQESHLADIINRLRDVPGFGGRPDLFHEVYGDGTIPYTAYAPYGGVTNFDYQRAVSSAFRDGNIAQLGNLPHYGGLTGQQAVVFIDNHDTQRETPTLTYKNGARYYLADTFMMAHPYGRPQLMSSYAFGSVHGQGPPSTSNGTTLATDCTSSAWICEHRDAGVAGMPGFRNAVAGTGIASVVTDGNGRLAFARGNRGYAAFNATGSTWSRSFSTSLPDGRYCNVGRGAYDRSTGACPGGAVTVTGGSFSAAIPADQAVALHVEARLDGPTPTATPTVTPTASPTASPTPTASPSQPAGSTRFTATVTTNPGQEVYVVGSIPQLGSWNPANGVKLSTTSGSYPTWSGSVDIPAGTAFEWKLVKVGNGVQWENDPNRTGTGGTTFTVTWNQPATNPPGEATVSFQATASTTYGQHVYVVGDLPALGGWDPAKGVRLSPTAYPVWTGQLSLPAGTAFSYKYVKRTDSGQVVWESGANRTATASGSVTLTDTWR
ncbi:alpha-amylase [Verrucosispora sp. ts21]|uniref:carbohydrate-binding module family 20 domain-containing protein n=1 Tax=Verrucosispora sp. ts21 TaxID=2069341 RepID=UPI000C88AEA3|nr:carbohydrate-binding module family 20 domain-containing protein [Verrucosispora sp. ts21]PMR58584.1 alpha-amylase [Verrucosispora sp. ts21]